jgi:hypothetical protein
LIEGFGFVLIEGFFVVFGKGFVVFLCPEGFVIFVVVGLLASNGF